MITVDKIEDGLPISVIIPLSHDREYFFYNYVMPLLEANNPNEIIVNKEKGSAPKKRNNAFKKVTQPYVFFMDDDILLPGNYLEKLYNTLIKKEKEDSNCGYVYTGYKGIVLHPQSHPMRGNFEIKSGYFNIKQLMKGNYISTMSLLNKKHFPFFDLNLKRFQDWDLYLNMYINKGIYGQFIPDLKFMAFYLDEGITKNNNSMVDSYNIIKNKYNL
ncbi:MAG: glycosyltransferase [bacterium]